MKKIFPGFRSLCEFDYPDLDKIVFPSSYVVNEIHAVNKIWFADKNVAAIYSVTQVIVRGGVRWLRVFFSLSVREAFSALIAEGLSEGLKREYPFLDWLIELKIQKKLSGNLDNDLFFFFCLRHCSFFPSFMTWFTKGICFPHLIWLTFRGKLSKRFSALFTDQAGCWGFWGFKIIHAESQCLCWNYVTAVFLISYCCWAFKTQGICWWFTIPALVSICYCLRTVLNHFNYDLWFQFGKRFLFCFNDCSLQICVIKFWSGF